MLGLRYTEARTFSAATRRFARGTNSVIDIRSEVADDGELLLCRAVVIPVFFDYFYGAGGNYRATGERAERLFVFHKGRATARLFPQDTFIHVWINGGVWAVDSTGLTVDGKQR
ncbi:hypothetical protein J4573_42455 [Actinomadura barringtoniae]|uniref:Uncharacterized protein n=1 Tax=Actinomadura barringtoniae TaxID=1427535 RepID=A0A939PPG9_9ACTN|nr:hypothetical protein [Actinomadura barringtoniae]MBO2453813.1 hypothetical protein [Actinomadura barringtoniae]